MSSGFFSIRLLQQGRERRIANDNLGEDFPEFLRQVCTHLVAWSNRD